MTERSKEEQFKDAEDDYPLEEDKEIIRSNRRHYSEASQILAVSETPGGKKLISSLKEDIEKSLQLLFETRQARYVSDLESAFNLLTKLTGAKSKVDAITQWIDSLGK